MQQRALFLLKNCCILFLISGCVGQSRMVKEDFSEHGVSIILADDPTFGNELQKLGFAVNPSPDSVVLRNTTQRGIVAFGIRFTKRFDNGHIATSDVISNNPSALLDPGQPRRYDKPQGGLISSGAARLITPDGIVEPALNSKVSTGYRTHVPWTIIGVSVDSVVFDDGEAVGRDELNVVKNLKAHVDAQQDLMEEISARLAKGEQLQAILQDLTASSKTDAPISDVRTMSARTPDKLYPLVRQHYLDELSTTQANQPFTPGKGGTKRCVLLSSSCCSLAVRFSTPKFGVEFGLAPHRAVLGYAVPTLKPTR